MKENDYFDMFAVAEATDYFLDRLDRRFKSFIFGVADPRFQEGRNVAYLFPEHPGHLLNGFQPRPYGLGTQGSKVFHLPPNFQLDSCRPATVAQSPMLSGRFLYFPLLQSFRNHFIPAN